MVRKREFPLAFLLGAGFNVDTGLEVGSLETARYPLVLDLAKVCFGLDALPVEKSIEELFQDAIDAKNAAPLDKLYDLIMEADYYLTPRLSPGGKRENNAYLRMLQDFTSAPILTFNYDSLVEILLLRLGHWRPDDGYGVPVQAKLISPPENSQTLPRNSLRPVLHLHGSLCVYPASFWIEKQPERKFGMLRPKVEPDFIFNPYSTGLCFVPFEQVPPGPSFRFPPERVIAPVPNKAAGLHGEFISRIHKKAVEIVQSIQTIVSIGYSFNPNDRTSYLPLLKAVRGARILLVVPEAQKLVPRLISEYPGVEWRAIPMTFREWVAGNYEGL